MDFKKTIKDFARDASAVLEIGPSYNPITPRAEGFNVTIMDHASREQLVEKYRIHPVDVSRIEEVDVVGSDLAMIQERKFSCIVASHVIEHTTDFIRFFQHSSRLLERGGKLMLIVPDKRLCFDYHRPLSTTGQVLDAHLSQKSRHHGALFDQCISAVYRGAVAWDVSTEAPFTQVHTFEEAASLFRAALQSSEYTDAHEWTFTPSSFRLLVHDLGRLGFIDLFEAEFQPSVGCEFFMSLSHERPQAQVPRAELVAATERELLAVSEEHRALQRRFQEQESRLQDQESRLRAQESRLRAQESRLRAQEFRRGSRERLRRVARELRDRLDSWMPGQAPLRKQVTRRLRGLLSRGG